MQYRLDTQSWTETLGVIHARLEALFPNYPPRYLFLDPVSQLVMSLLGGQTYSHISREAHTNLMRRFRSWSEVRDADPQTIEACIGRVTHAPLKAVRIKSILSELSAGRDRPSLANLKPLSVQQAHDWLERIDGIGPKIAAAVLNTSTLRRRSLVIDSHHLRILIRLGLLPPGSNLVKAYRLTMPLIPADWCAERIDVHHMLFKKLGQDVCRKSRPRCWACPLAGLCRHAMRDEADRDPTAAPPNRPSGPPSLPAPSRRARSGSGSP